MRADGSGVATADCGGVPLRAPNDLTLARHGGVYFTDPGGSRTESIGTVHYIDRAGKTTLSASGMRVPNSLVLAPGGDWLYVAESVLVGTVRRKSSKKVGPHHCFASLRLPGSFFN
jgi:gluconolactonase